MIDGDASYCARSWATPPSAGGDVRQRHRGREASCRAGHEIRFEGLTKRFHRVGGEKVNAIDEMSLCIEEGQFVVLVGPSGCGKTTLLRCLAGLESPDTGLIEFGGVTVFSSDKRIDAPPENRDAAMLFQSYALWPHMTVFDNVAYPLKSQKVPKARIADEVTAILERVQCAGLAHQYPGQISGGQQQRIALARALVAGNKIVLFDEPLSNIDAKVRDELRTEILRIQRDIGFTAIYVTHDQVEALTLADKIIVLKEGRIAQAGAPLDVYDQPASQYVARFMGALNECRGSLIERESGVAIYETPVGPMAVKAAGGGPVRQTAILGFRPTACRIYTRQADAPEARNLIPVDIVLEIFSGAYFEYVVKAASHEFRCWTFNRLPENSRGGAWLHVPDTGIRILEAPQ